MTPICILFPSSVTNDTKQIFVTCRELNNSKVALIYSILGIINLDKISNSEYIKGKSLWVNISFTEQEQINDRGHLSFSFKTQSLNDLLNFSINVIDDDIKLIKFSSVEQKIIILNFKKYFWNELRPTPTKWAKADEICTPAKRRVNKFYVWRHQKKHRKF